MQVYFLENPTEAEITATDTVHPASAAISVPETAADRLSTVVVVLSGFGAVAGPRVVVSVIRGELHSVVIAAKRIEPDVA